MNLPKTVALYARVSSQKQAEEQTIDSQLEAIRNRIANDQFHIEPDFEFCDNGYSGAQLVRPALERLRDLLATSSIDRLYVHSPDRLSRKMAHQAILLEELHKYDCEIVFLNQEGIANSPESNLLIQMQGMIAEYEREKILERTRRGRKYSAAKGNVSVFGRAPYGYRYINKAQGDGSARWEIDPLQSEHVKLIFHWVAEGGCSLSEVARRLAAQSVVTAKGKAEWDRSTIRGILLNPAYYGQAAYGKERLMPRKPGKRSKRGAPVVPRQAKVAKATEPSEQIVISVPAIIDQALFQRAREIMDDNRKRQRERQSGGKYLLSGLVLCGVCGSAYCSRRSGGSKYFYYRCIGTDRHRHEGKEICDNASVKGDEIESLVWSEVCKLLRDPDRLRVELERRRGEPGADAEQLQRMEKTVSELRGRLDRLIDGYETGLLERREFEQRIGPLRERHDREKAALASLRGRASTEIDMASASEVLASLSDSVGEQLADAAFSLRRDLVKLLIERIEIHREEVRLVYKVPPNPFVQGPDNNRGFLQHWLSRADVALRLGDCKSRSDDRK
ncbi:recombinase family protein [Novipirellula sp. SH528]|uniref:recombinase family protein n=1 Tax=Novipirellula sp. SH528 TaxID=3454466 RepID=UPI003FA07BFD